MTAKSMTAKSMKRATILLSSLVLLGGLIAAPVVQGGKPTPPKDNPEVPGMLKDLKSIVKDKKGRRDADGERILDKLATLYPTLNTKQKKSIVKAMGKVFSAKRKVTEVGLLLAAGRSLAEFEEAGAKVLSGLVEDKKRRWRKKEWLDLRAELLRYFGRPAIAKYAEQLLDLATRDKDDILRATAGESLGKYNKHDQKLRKRITEKLIKELSAIYNQSKANVDPRDYTRKTYEDRYAAIVDPWMATLTKLTSQKLRDPVAWLKWWNKNKGKNWDKKGYGGKPKPAKKTAAAPAKK